MKPRSFMLIAGEASGDLIGAALVRALQDELAMERPFITSDYQPLHTSLEPRFFGAGGPAMARAGVQLSVDLTAHAVVGISDVLKKLFALRRVFLLLRQIACERQPDVIVCVDFSEFNRRFAHSIKSYVRQRADWFHGWQPKVVRYVSPQVWASRPGRAYGMERDFDLVLSILPFEKEWYAKRVPRLRVEFIGHPILDRHSAPASKHPAAGAAQTLLLLPGSRHGELRRHLPVMLEALELLRRERPELRALMDLPGEALVEQARQHSLPPGLEVRCRRLAESLAAADVAIASTGTVTLECALFGVPTVAIYKTSWATYAIARPIVTVKYAAMPNILAGQEVFPELIQQDATAHNIAAATSRLLRDEQQRAVIKSRLKEIVATLGGPGASARAATAILGLLEESEAGVARVRD